MTQINAYKAQQWVNEDRCYRRATVEYNGDHWIAHLIISDLDADWDGHGLTPEAAFYDAFLSEAIDNDPSMRSRTNLVQPESEKTTHVES